MTKAQLTAALQACRKVRIGWTLHIVSPELADGIIQEALRKGCVVEEDGVRQWIEYREVLDTTKSGSEIYTWRGDRVKCLKYLVQVDVPTGKASQIFLRVVWRKPE